MALIGATVTVTALSLDASSSDLGVVEFIDPGADSAEAALLSADFPYEEFRDGIGHDGQATYAIARSPMHLDEVAQYLDRPRYRAGRPLLSWLGWLLHPQGGGTGLVVALVSVNAAALLLGGIAAGGLAFSAGARPRVASYVALLFPLAPGSLAAFALTTSDLLAIALALCAILLSWQERPRSAIAAGVLAVLAKESILLVLIGYSLSRRRRPDWLLAGAATVAAGTWYLALRVLIPESSEAVVELRPFVDIPKILGGWLDGYDTLAALTVLVTSALGVAVLVNRGVRSPFAGVVILQLAMLPMLSADVLALNWNATRTMLPLLMISAIALSSRPGSNPAGRPSPAGATTDARGEEP